MMSTGATTFVSNKKAERYLLHSFLTPACHMLPMSHSRSLWAHSGAGAVRWHPEPGVPFNNATHLWLAKFLVPFACQVIKLYIACSSTSCSSYTTVIDFSKLWKYLAGAWKHILFPRLKVSCFSTGSTWGGVPHRLKLGLGRLSPCEEDEL